MDIKESYSTLDGKQTQSSLDPSQEDPNLGILGCCKKTIEMHANNNPMMVCSECKQIIKCFDNETGYSNYKKFCTSRHRKITTGYFNNWYIVVFKSYDTFST